MPSSNSFLFRDTGKVKDSELSVHSATEQTRKYTGDKGNQDLERAVTKKKGMKDKMNPAILIRNEK